MTLRTFLLCALTILTLPLTAQKITPEAEQRAAELVAQMTLDEKLSYIGGYNGFFIRPISRLGIPEIRMADGPQGVRNDTYSTLYPCGIAAAATWNTDMLHLYGRSLGRDARARGVHILLGPGVNIYRSPLCGRNYEYFGEDPYLTSQIAAAYIEGLQSEGVMATVKHFCGNNQEYSRHNTSSDIDERTLHEIYLPAFRTAVQKASTGAVMSSYNPVNSVHTTENKELAINILRNLWGFKGIYMSDWTATYSTIGAANNGLDLEMSWGQFMNVPKLKEALDNGTITMQTIDTKCRHILQTLIAFGFLDKWQTDNSIPLDNPASAQAALEIAREGLVLLKNDGILPLSRKIKRIVVAGPNATAVPTGGGSGLVMPYHTVSVAQGLREIDKKIKVAVLTPEPVGDFAACGMFTTPDGKPGLYGEFFANRNLEGPAVHRTITDAIDYFWTDKPAEQVPAKNFSARWSGVFKPDFTGKAKFRIAGDDGYRLFIDDREILSDWYEHFVTIRTVTVDVEKGKSYNIRLEYFNAYTSGTLAMTVAAEPDVDNSRTIASADAVVYCAGFDSAMEGENRDRTFSLPQKQLEEIDSIGALNSNLIVIVNAGGGVDFTPFIDKAKAIIMAWYPGEQGGTALAEVITGRVNPSGRLPITIERRPEDNPTFASYRPNVETIYKSPERVSYDEGIFVGYRGYDRAGTVPLFPFGYGLSYTTFKYDNMSTMALPDGGIRVCFDITNTGTKEGAEVAQIYVSDIKASVPRPPKELKSFAKLKLKPGKTERVSLDLPADAFAFYDMDSHQFVVEPGEFNILVGASAADIRLSQTITK